MRAAFDLLCDAAWLVWWLPRWAVWSIQEERQRAVDIAEGEVAA